jgi:hypothetical protein
MDRVYCNGRECILRPRENRVGEVFYKAAKRGLRTFKFKDAERPGGVGGIPGENLDLFCYGIKSQATQRGTEVYVLGGNKRGRGHEDQPIGVRCAVAHK